MTDIIFYLGLATLITHEMDAMLNHEWRVLPLTSWMPEKTGMLTFIYFHIPLFAILIALVASKTNRTRFWSRMGISIFLVAHAGLHASFGGSIAYEFSSLSSIVLIYGGGFLGLIYILLSIWMDRSKEGS